jgi:hypothetical protein
MKIEIELETFGKVQPTPDIERNSFKFDKIFVGKRLKKLSVKIVYLNESDQEKILIFLTELRVFLESLSDSAFLIMSQI